MIRVKFITATLLFFLAGTVELSAQNVVARVAGLEENKDYMELLRGDERLRSRTDSLMGVIRQVRSSLSKNAELRDSLYQQRADSLLLVLSDAESAVYATRAEKMKFIDQINAIEQNHVLKSMGNIGDAQSAQGSKSIYNNAYFKKSIEAEDFKMLMDVHAKEKTAQEYSQTYAANYLKIKTLYDKYIVAQSEADAEAVYAEMSGVMDDNMILNKQLQKLWTEIYDQKVYVYSYFLEKEGREDILQLVENQMTEARQEKLNSIDNCVSESVADYCLQKPIALNYEMYVAKLLNLTSAMDSLSVAARAVRKIDYRMPKIDFERRSFVDYAPIEFSSRSPYNAQNPIPECVVYEYGTIYRILLGTYKYKQAVNIFRGASPLSIETLEDGRFSYYAGGLKTRAEAEKAVEIMKKKGFRNPEIVEWCDSRKTNLSDVNGGEPITYRIEIKGGELDDMIHEVIETMAAESQITKIAEDSFIIGTFDSKAIAERLAQAIAKCNESLDVKVVELKPESDEENEEDDEA